MKTLFSTSGHRNINSAEDSSLMTNILFAAMSAFALNMPSISKIILLLLLGSLSMILKSYIKTLSVIFSAIFFAGACILPLERVAPTFTVSSVWFFTFVVALSFIASIVWRRIRTGNLDAIHGGPLRIVPSLSELTLLLPYLFIVILIQKWISINDLSIIISQFGPEDNASWIGPARALVDQNLQVTNFLNAGGGLTIGSVITFMSFLSGSAYSHASENAVAITLQTVRNTYAFFILSGAIASGFVTQRLRRTRNPDVPRSAGVAASFAVLAEFSFLGWIFISFGHLSFVVAAVFGIIFLNTVISETKPNFAEDVFRVSLAIFLVFGMGTSWTPYFPVTAATFAIMIYWFYKQRSRTGRPFIKISIGLAILAAFLLRNPFIGILYNVGALRSRLGITGTVAMLSEVVVAAVFLILALAIFLEVFHSQLPKIAGHQIGELFLAISSLFVMVLWVATSYFYGEQRYGSWKAAALLAAFTIPISFSMISLAFKHEARLTELLFSLALFFCTISFTAGWMSFYGPTRVSASTWVTDLATLLKERPNVQILCLNPDPERWQDGYVCTRLAGSLTDYVGTASRTWSGLPGAWGQALIYRDRTPGGIMVPEANTFGGSALAEIKKRLSNGETDNLVLLTTSGKLVDPQNVVWDEGRWWLNDIPWKELNTYP